MGELTPTKWHHHARPPAFTMKISCTKIFPNVGLAAIQTNVLHLYGFLFFPLPQGHKAHQEEDQLRARALKTKWPPGPGDASKDGVWKKKLACLLSSMLTRLVCCNLCFFSMHEHPVLFVSLSTQCFFFHRAHSALALPTQTKGSAIKISCHLSIPCFIGSVQNILTLSFSFEHSV